MGVSEPRDPSLTPLSAINQAELGQEGLGTAGEPMALVPAQVGQAITDVLEVAAPELARFQWEHYIKLALGLLGTVLGAVLGIVDPKLLPIATAISSGSLLFSGGEVQAHVRAGRHLLVRARSPGSTGSVSTP